MWPASIVRVGVPDTETGFVNAALMSIDWPAT